MAKEVAIYDILEDISSAETDIHSPKYRLLLAKLAKEFIEKDVYLRSNLFKDFLEVVKNSDTDIFDKQLTSLIESLVKSEEGHQRYRYWIHVWFILVTDPGNADTDALEENFKWAKEAAISLTTVSDKAVREYPCA